MIRGVAFLSGRRDYEFRVNPNITGNVASLARLGDYTATGGHTLIVMGERVDTPSAGGGR